MLTVAQGSLWAGREAEGVPGGGLGTSWYWASPELSRAETLAGLGGVLMVAAATLSPAWLGS